MRRTLHWRLLAGLCLASVTLTCWSAPPRSKPEKRLPPLKTPEDKLQFLEAIRASFPSIKVGKQASFTSADLDDSLNLNVSRSATSPMAPLAGDETFVRRVYLDLTGHLPEPKRVLAFVKDTSPNKRAQLVDELLEGDDWARKWARYWRSVIFYESNANKNTVNPQALEDWFFSEFKKNTSWDRIVAELVSASPQRNKGDKENSWNQSLGPNNFILACEREPEIIASNTARIFMGISIGCAECHDHPFDKWKREQFHEMAAFFAPGRYYMTNQYDPSKKTQMNAQFLLGEKPPASLKPDQRRVALAAYLIYNPDNYWFARAFVNRIWNELIGDGFYSVDSLGPDKEVAYPLVANRLGATFRAGGFDVKWLFRLIMNSQAYQREMQTIEGNANLFTAVRPARLKSYEVADNITGLIGADKQLRRDVESVFDVNPSVPQRDQEGTIQQALLMMNNPKLNRGLENSALQKQLAAIRDNNEMIRQAFLGVLARTPTAEESARYVRLIQQSASRQEAATDLLWILVNSAEFVTRS